MDAEDVAKDTPDVAPNTLDYSYEFIDDPCYIYFVNNYGCKCDSGADDMKAKYACVGCQADFEGLVDEVQGFLNRS